MLRRWIKIGAGAGVGILTIVGFFVLLSLKYGFIITDMTGDITCPGTYDNPCVSDFSVRNPRPYVVDIYSKNQTKLDFSPEIIDYALFVKDGRCGATGKCACMLENGKVFGFKGWRCTDFTNATKPRVDKVYNFRFPAYTTKYFRLAGIKNNPGDTVKWGFGTTEGYLDPVWNGISGDGCTQFTCPAYTDMSLKKVGDKLNLTFGGEWATYRGYIYAQINQQTYSFSDASSFGATYDYSIVRNTGTDAKFSGAIYTSGVSQAILDAGYTVVFQLIDKSDGMKIRPSSGKLWHNDKVYIDWRDFENPSNKFEVWNKTTVYLTDNGSLFHGDLIYDPIVVVVNVSIGVFNESRYLNGRVTQNGTFERLNGTEQGFIATCSGILAGDYPCQDAIDGQDNQDIASWVADQENSWIIINFTRNIILHNISTYERSEADRHPDNYTIECFHAGNWKLISNITNRLMPNTADYYHLDVNLNEEGESCSLIRWNITGVRTQNSGVLVREMIFWGYNVTAKPFEYITPVLNISHNSTVKFLHNVSYSADLPSGSNVSVQGRAKQFNYLDDLIFYFDFDGDSGTTLNDISNQGHQAVIQGANANVATDGKFSQGYYNNFDSASNALFTTDLDNISQNLTICAWFKPLGYAGGRQEILELWDNKIEFAYGAIPSVWDGIIFTANGDGSDDCNLDGQAARTTLKDVWYFGCARINGTHCTSYLNGTVDLVDTFNGSIIPTAAKASIGARRNGQQPMNGTVDELMMWNRSLTDAEIADLYAWTSWNQWSPKNYSNPASFRNTVNGTFAQLKYTFQTNGTDTPVLYNYTIGYGDELVSGGADVTPPVISVLRNTSTTNQSSDLSFTCDEACNSTTSLWNCATRDGSCSFNRYNYNNTFELTKVQNFSGLQNFIQYYAKVKACDSSGNCAENNTFDFYTAQNIDDTSPLTIIAIRNTSTTNESSDISHQLDEGANATYWLYNGTQRNSSQIVYKVDNNTFDLFHNQNFSILKNATIYYLNKTWCDATGNCASNNTFNFITATGTTPSADICDEPTSSPWLINNGTVCQIASGTTYNIPGYQIIITDGGLKVWGGLVAYGLYTGDGTTYFVDEDATSILGVS